MCKIQMWASCRWSPARPPLALCLVRVRWRCQEVGLVWSTGYGGCSMASDPWSICQWSHNTLSADLPSSRRGLIYGDTESGEKHTPAADEGVSFAPEAFKAGELPSAGRARIGSPEVCRPAHLRWSGVGVHLGAEGGTGSEMLFKEPLFLLEGFILRCSVFHHLFF